MMDRGLGLGGRLDSLRLGGCGKSSMLIVFCKAFPPGDGMADGEEDIGEDILGTEEEDVVLTALGMAIGIEGVGNGRAEAEVGEAGARLSRDCE